MHQLQMHVCTAQAWCWHVSLLECKSPLREYTSTKTVSNQGGFWKISKPDVSVQGRLEGGIRNPPTHFVWSHLIFFFGGGGILLTEFERDKISYVFLLGLYLHVPKQDPSLPGIDLDRDFFFPHDWPWLHSLCRPVKWTWLLSLSQDSPVGQHIYLDLARSKST